MRIINSFIQKAIKLMPVILLFMIATIDRNSSLYVAFFLIILFGYSTILIARVLESKKKWYQENSDLADLGIDESIDTMGDITKKIEKKLNGGNNEK